MPIKEKSVLKKAVFEYESPDGDIWEITIADSGANRAYVQCHQIGVKQKNDDGEEEVAKVDKDPFTIDIDMLLEVGDAYRQMTKKVEFTGVDRRYLHSPNIVDHRGLEQSNAIQAQVDRTMQNRDDSVSPIQSFTPAPNTPAIVKDDYTQFRSGVDPNDASQPVDETPEEWQMREEEGLAEWQKDAQARRNMSRPMAPGRTGGMRRPTFRKVAADDII